MMNTGAFIHDLLDWIDNNLDSRLDIDTVARRSGYSKWHLQRMFKEHTGLSPRRIYSRAKAAKIGRALNPQRRTDSERGDRPGL
jgi:AraC-like DNA-binding protein